MFDAISACTSKMHPVCFVVTPTRACRRRCDELRRDAHAVLRPSVPAHRPFQDVVCAEFLRICPSGLVLAGTAGCWCGRSRRFRAPSRAGRDLLRDAVTSNIVGRAQVLEGSTAITAAPPLVPVAAAPAGSEKERRSAAITATATDADWREPRGLARGRLPATAAVSDGGPAPTSSAPGYRRDGFLVQQLATMRAAGLTRVVAVTGSGSSLTIRTAPRRVRPVERLASRQIRKERADGDRSERRSTGSPRTCPRATCSGPRSDRRFVSVSVGDRRAWRVRSRDPNPPPHRA